MFQESEKLSTRNDTRKESRKMPQKMIVVWATTNHFLQLFFLCFLTLSGLVKSFPHSVHSHRSCLWWVRSCLRRWSGRLYAFPQYWHLQPNTSRHWCSFFGSSFFPHLLQNSIILATLFLFLRGRYFRSTKNWLVFSHPFLIVTLGILWKRKCGVNHQWLVQGFISNSKIAFLLNPLV